MGPARRGLHVLLNDFGEGEYYRVENVYVHDIAGNNNRGAWASNGIHFSVVGNVRASNFHDVRVQGNRSTRASGRSTPTTPSSSSTT